MIDRIGFHPFIIVRLGDEQDPARRLVICRTQNEVAQFVDDLVALPGFRDSKLLRGMERALQLEIYEAADLLFSWAKEPAETVDEVAYIGLPGGVHSSAFYEYPAFELGAGASRLGPDERAAMLIAAFDAYDRTDGNDALRVMLMEALAFALSRVLGARGRYREAELIVDRALVRRPYSMHLKAVKHALGLKLADREVPARLAKFIGEDNGYLEQFVCPVPFHRFDIGPDGGVLVCCGHWLPTSIGNILEHPVDAILNSPKAQKIRQSVNDGSYKYCNHLECAAMINDALPARNEIKKPWYARAAAGDYTVEGVDVLLFAFDQTCNLSCPSCRRERIVEKVSTSIEKARAVEEKLVPLLPSVRVLHINPAGELFASKPSRKLLELINDEHCPDLRLDIISNGTLFDEEEWNKFPGIHNKIRSIRISVDAARKETFETLRRLGKYEPFVENMRFLRHLRTSGVIPQLKYSFTYQLDNFREMREFVAFCDEMHADFAQFERLQNIAFTHEEYRRKAVHYPDHPLYDEFLGVIKDPIFRSLRVAHDFDFGGVEKLTRDEERLRLDDTLSGLVLR